MQFGSQKIHHSARFELFPPDFPIGQDAPYRLPKRGAVIEHDGVRKFVNYDILREAGRQKCDAEGVGDDAVSVA